MSSPRPWLPELVSLALLWLGVQILRFAVPAYVGASDLLTDFDLTAAGAGLLIGVYFPVYAAAQLPAGFLVDRYPVNRIMRLGALALLASTLAFAAAPNFGAAVGAKAMSGLADALLWQAILRRSAQLAPHSYTKAVGLLVAAQGTGQVAALLGLPLLLTALSWRPVTLLSVVPLSIAVVAVWMLGGRSPPPGDVPTGHHLQGLRTTLSHPRFWPLALTAAAWNGGQFGILAWLPRFARDVLGRPMGSTGVMAAVMSAGVVAGGLLTVLTANPERRRWLFYGGAAVTVALQLAFALAGQGMAAGIYPVVFLLGAVFAAYFLSISLISVFIPARHLGTATGTLNTINFIPAFVVPWTMGLLLDWVDRPLAADPIFSASAYRGAFLLPSLALLAALAVATLLIMGARSRSASNPRH